MGPSVLVLGLEPMMERRAAVVHVLVRGAISKNCGTASYLYDNEYDDALDQKWVAKARR